VLESDRIRQSLENLFKKSRQLRENVDKKGEEASKLKSAISKRQKEQGKANMNPIDFSDRCRGAIWGQIVGDAAALGTHWIYDLDAMRKTYPEVAGFEEPREGHYHFGKLPGDLTHYGEAALVMAESVAALGRFDQFHFGARFVEHFGSASYKGYLDKATRGTLERKAAFEREHPGHEFVFQSGADDQQMAAVSRLAPLVVAHFHDPQLLEYVVRATRVTQDNDGAVLYAKADAMILFELLRGRDFRWALHETAEMVIKDPVHGAGLHQEMRNAEQAESLSVIEATDQFGQGCPLPQSFPSSIQCVLKHGDSYRDAILANIRAGGDNAGRGAMLGAWMGAMLGVKSIPAEWRRKLRSFDAVNAAVEAIVGRVVSVGS
jgi:ADP-ribosylglycohydrolase